MAKKVRGRDTSKDITDVELVAFSPAEGDIFLKHDPTSTSTAVTIRENEIGLHTANGNVGLLIKNNGQLLVQGKLIFKTYGDNIVKGPFTENPFSFIPSTIYTQMPQLLFRFPAVGMIFNIMDKFKIFSSITGGQ